MTRRSGGPLRSRRYIQLPNELWKRIDGFLVPESGLFDYHEVVCRSVQILDVVLSSEIDGGKVQVVYPDGAQHPIDNQRIDSVKRLREALLSAREHLRGGPNTPNAVRQKINEALDATSDEV